VLAGVVVVGVFVVVSRTVHLSDRPLVAPATLAGVPRQPGSPVETSGSAYVRQAAAGRKVLVAAYATGRATATVTLARVEARGDAVLSAAGADGKMRVTGRARCVTPAAPEVIVCVISEANLTVLVEALGFLSVDVVSSIATDARFENI
jgi:hypothetical protein